MHTFKMKLQRKNIIVNFHFFMTQKDKVEKLLEEHNDVFADIINVLLFNGKETVKEDSLEDMNIISQYKVDDGFLHEQVAMFKSDFRIVAEYFTQKRKSGRYTPNLEAMEHWMKYSNFGLSLTEPRN